MSRSRSKLDTTPIGYDEVVDSPSLRGMVSFLSVPHTGLPQLDFSTPLSGIPVSVIPDAGVVETGIPAIRIRKAQTARDGHSLGEQVLYEALWNAAHPQVDGTRVLTAGYRTLAGLARLTVNNCKANLQSLRAKKAIEELSGFTYTQGRTYVVYSEVEVLRRRQAGGLTHYIKTRGVAFVNERTGIPLQAVPE